MSTRTPSSPVAAPSACPSGGPPVPEGTNLVLVRGVIRRDPEFRILSSGDELLTCDLTVRAGEAPAESVPVVWPNPGASASRLTAGDDVVVVGRVRRRFFRAAGTTASRTEVCAERILRARALARVRAAVGAVLEPIDAD
jgi:single-stranded DNA-binding protein